MTRVLSIDSFNENSGPGIRVLIDISYNDEGIEVNCIDLVNQIRRYRHYIEMNNGGVTFKGNIQNNVDFLKNICTLCHKSNINTCIELKTSEFNSIYEILYLLDYIILIKDIDKIDEISKILTNKKINFLIK